MFGLIRPSENSAWNLRQSYPYSVSKLNQFLSIVISLAWVILAIYEFYNSCWDSMALCCSCLFIILIVFSAFVISLIIYFFARGFMWNKTKRDGEIMYYNY